jgi:polar amino acid transport system substrate-binding protein
MNLNIKKRQLLRLFSYLSAFYLVFSFAVAPVPACADDLNVSIAMIPTRAEVDAKGTARGVYVELFQRLDNSYMAGSLDVRVYPFVRSINNLKAGLADIHFPMIRSDRSENLPFIWVPEPILNPIFVLYSRKDKILSEEAELTGKVIETIAGPRSHSYGFKVGFSESIASGLSKLSLGRIDGFIGEQGITDAVLREKGFDNIHREYFSVVDMGMAVSNSPEGEVLSSLLVKIIKNMKQDPETKKFLDSIYPPFDHWQTYW